MEMFLRKPLFLVAALLLAGLLARPAMSTDLLPLVTEGSALKAQLSGIVLTSDNLCAQMISAGNAVLLVRKTNVLPVSGSLNLMRRRCSG